jgi:hypothetical protein
MKIPEGVVMRIEGGLKGYSAGNNRTPVKIILQIKLITM